MDFWDFFMIMLIFVPLAILWAGALLDVFRRDDLSNLSRVLWVIIIFLLPILGTLLYLLLRKPGATIEEREMLGASREKPSSSSSSSSTADQLAKLSELHDRGKLTDEEFAAEKAKVIGSGSAPA